MNKNLVWLSAIGILFCGESRAALPDAASAAPAAITASAAPANPAPPPSTSAKRGAAELEKLAMPIALHPDPLIAVLLPAAVYPLEIVQAARFVKDTNNIPKVDEQPWDANVKAVAKFPQLIAKMDAELSWTVALGQAFLDEPKELMDTIQGLRVKAQTAGTLQNSPQQIVTVTNVVSEKIVEQKTVVVTNTVVEIQPSNPQVVYVPSYPPAVYYPPPSYVYDPWAPLVTFGLGMAAGAIIANNWNHCDWHGGGVYNDVDINVDRNNNINGNRNTARPTDRAATTSRTQQKWQPDQNRLRSSGASPSTQSREARGWSGASGATGGGLGGGARGSTQPAGIRSPGMSASTQPARAGGGSQGISSGQRPAASGGGARPSATSSSVSRPGASSSSAFSGVGGGSSARSSSSRGYASTSGGSRGGGYSGGGRSGAGGRSGGGRR